MKKNLILAALFAACTASAPFVASADPHWRGDIRHFHERDIHHWATGHWVHGYHDGRLAWWWVVGTAIDSALWYAYAQPVYPYPNPYTPPTVVVSPPPVAAAPVPPPAEPSVWYFCQSNGRYYPYVSSCPEGWRAVPAAPPGR